MIFIQRESSSSQEQWKPLNSKMNSNQTKPRGITTRLKTQQNQYQSRKSHKKQFMGQNDREKYIKQKHYQNCNRNINGNNQMVLSKFKPFNPFDDQTNENNNNNNNFNLSSQQNYNYTNEHILTNININSINRNLYHNNQQEYSKENIDKQKIFFTLKQKLNIKNQSQYKPILAITEENRSLNKYTQNYIFNNCNNSNQKKIKVTQLFKISGQGKKNYKPHNNNKMRSSFYRLHYKTSNNSYKPAQTDYGNITITGINSSNSFNSLNYRQKNLQKILKVRQYIRKKNNKQFRKIKNQRKIYEKQKQLQKKSHSQKKIINNNYSNNPNNSNNKQNFNDISIAGTDLIKKNNNTIDIKKKVLKDSQRNIKRFVKVDENKIFYLKPENFKNTVQKIFSNQIKNSLKIMKTPIINYS